MLCVLDDGLEKVRTILLCGRTITRRRRQTVWVSRGQLRGPALRGVEIQLEPLMSLLSGVDLETPFKTLAIILNLPV